MMRKRQIGAALICGALLGVSALGVAGCGASSAPAGTFVPKGSQAAVPSGGASTGVPALVHFPFPSSVHIDFQTPLPADPQDASVAVTDENFQLAYYYSLYSEGGNQQFAPYIASPTVLSAVQANVAQNFAKHERIRGTLRIFDTSVTGVDGAPSDLAVSFCGDNSQLVSVSAQTGQVVPDSTPANDHYFSQTDSYLPRNGKWALIAISTIFYPNGPAKECKP